MKEFMLFISTVDSCMATKSAEEKTVHIQKVGAYIQGLVKAGKMKAAQPLASEGVKVYGIKGAITDGPYNESKELISGYYHILANDLEEAVAIAKADPRFEDADWIIEVRPVLKVEGIN